MASGDDYPYRRIVSDLREQVLSGQRAPGDRMPSESELSATYHTSRPTVRRALAVLRGEGLIVTGQGSGTFVRARPGIQICVTGSNYRRHRAPRCSLKASRLVRTSPRWPASAPRPT